MTAFEDFVNLELPRRSAFLTYEITSYDGDPNDGSAPAILQGAPKGTWFLQQTGSIYWRKRTSAADSWVIANLNETYEAMDIYVRAADGNDSNPGTSVLPLATIQAAIYKIPQNVNHTVRIHVGPHTGSGYDPPEIHNLNLQANIWIIGDGGGGSSDGFTEIVASATAQSGSTNLLLRTTGGLSASEYYGFGVHFGRTIEILTGAAAGDRKTIRNNDTTDIYPSLPFSAAISNGDTYRIIDPETVIYFASDSPKLVQRCGVGSTITDQSPTYRIGFINFKFSAASSIFANLEESSVVFYGIVTDKRITLDLYSATLNSGLEINNVTSVFSPSVVTDLSVPNNLSWTGWGLSNRGTGTNGQVWVWKGSFNGVCSAGGLSCTLRPTVILNGGSFVGDYIPGLVMYDFTDCYVYGSLQEILFGTLSSPAHMIEVNQSYLRFNCYAANIVYIRSNTDGVQVRNSGICRFFSTQPSGIRITTNSVGIEVDSLGQVEFGSNRPVMTCGGGDLTVDNEFTTYSIGALGSNKLLAELGSGLIRG